MSLKEIFIAEVNNELQKHLLQDPELISEDDIVHLPKPVQKYFRYCGFLGRQKITNAQVLWTDVFLKQSFGKKYLKISCAQFNSVPEPARFAFMKSKIGGFIPFEGRDKYQDGHGNMLIKLLKIFTVGDSKGAEMDVSALVTILAEALFVPGYALQPYIYWEPIDDFSAKATIENKGIKASGIFFFNDVGECVRFETEDRYFTDKNGTFKKYKWSAYLGKYKNLNGIMTPGDMKAAWHLPSGDFEYFKGKVVVNFNINTFRIDN